MQRNAVAGTQSSSAHELLVRLAVNRVKGKIECAVRDEIFDYLMRTGADGGGKALACLLELMDGLTGSTSRRRNPALRKGILVALLPTLLVGAAVGATSLLQELPRIYTLAGPGHWASIVLSFVIFSVSMYLLAAPALVLGYMVPAVKPWIYRAFLLGALGSQLVLITYLNGPWSLVFTATYGTWIVGLCALEWYVASLARDLRQRGEQVFARRSGA